MPWLNATDKKIQSFHWIGHLEIEELTFINGGGQPEETNYIDFLELSGRQQTARTLKFVMGDTYNGSGSHVIYNVWFADSVAELQRIVETEAPTKIFYNYNSMPQPSVFTLNLTTRYMAINFDGAYGNVDPASTYISIYAY
jgi:hypothetical protein